MAMRPALVLLDEPLANLDPHLREAMQSEFRRLHREIGATFVYVTHDQAELWRWRIGSPSWTAAGSSRSASRSRSIASLGTEMVGRFVGRGIIVGATISRANDGTNLAEAFGARIRTRGEASSGERRKLCIRPTDIRLANGPDSFRARVAEARYQGAHTALTVIPVEAADAAELFVEHRGLPPAPGDLVDLVVDDAWIIPEGLS